MQHNRFEYLCSEAKAGRDAFVCHPDSNEEGMVTNCILNSDHMVVQTPQRQTRCWDYHECNELSHPKSSPMI
jgi:hypothetical protein